MASVKVCPSSGLLVVVSSSHARFLLASSQMDFYTSNHQRQLLLDRANRLIEKYDLPVPRSFSTRFINFEFWANVFIRVFGIRCATSLRTPSERVEAIKACINTLSSLIGKSLDHIQADALLHYDMNVMNNLIEIVELSEQCSDTEDIEDFNYNDIDEDEDNLFCRNRNNILSDANVNVNNQIVNKSYELATQLHKALKNQTLASEIEKKIKQYFGDVTVQPPQSNNSKLRSSRQSIVRTRAIQPSRSTFDYTFQKSSKRNQVLSVELEKLFPELSSQLLDQIKEQEKSLIMSERNIRIWHENLATNQAMRTLNDAIIQQRQRVDLLHKELKEEDSVSKAKVARAQKIAIKNSTRDNRIQKALLQKEIDSFYNDSTAAYLNARSYLERILMTEFNKVDANKRQHIKEIRKYLRNHYEEETENLRSLLDNFDSM